MTSSRNAGTQGSQERPGEGGRLPHVPGSPPGDSRPHGSQPALGDVGSREGLLEQLLSKHKVYCRCCNAALDPHVVQIKEVWRKLEASREHGWICRRVARLFAHCTACVEETGLSLLL